MTQEKAVSLKLLTSQPEVWFAQAKAQFTLRGSTANEMKYVCYVIATLDQPTATWLLELISSPPTDNKYSALKTGLTATFGLSKQECLPLTTLPPIR